LIVAALVALFHRESQINRDNFRMMEFLYERGGRGQAGRLSYQLLPGLSPYGGPDSAPAWRPHHRFADRRDPKHRPADSVPVDFVLMAYPILDLPPLPQGDADTAGLTDPDG
jgi:hypothetical protein